MSWETSMQPMTREEVQAGSLPGGPTVNTDTVTALRRFYHNFGSNEAGPPPVTIQETVGLIRGALELAHTRLSAAAPRDSAITELPPRTASQAEGLRYSLREELAAVLLSARGLDDRLAELFG